MNVIYFIMNFEFANQSQNKKSFRCEAKDIFLTYPKTDLSKDDLLTFLRTKLDEKVAYIVVAQEFHEDGSLHLHAQVQLKKLLSVTNPNTFDLMHRHCNIQRTLDSSAANAYVKKDNNFIEFGEFNVVVELRKKKTKNKFDNTYYLTCNIVEEVLNNNMNLLFVPSLLGARKVFEQLKERSIKSEIQPFLPSIWLNLELPVLKQKQKHYWIWSLKVSKGKSAFLRLLDSMYLCHRWNVEEEFQDYDNETQFILFDAFTKGSSVKITTLEKLCDGQHTIKRKNNKTVMTKNPIVIVCSNLPMNEVYHIDERLQCRFNELNVDDYDFNELADFGKIYS